MYYTRYVLKLESGKSYEFPLKWLVNWVHLNTSYETMVLFTKKASQEELKKAIKAAQKEGIGGYIKK